MKIHELEYMFQFYSAFIKFFNMEYKGVLGVMSDRDGLLNITQELVDKVNKMYETHGTPHMKLFVRPNPVLSVHHIFMKYDDKEVQVCMIDPGMYFKEEIEEEYRDRLLSQKEI